MKILVYAYGNPGRQDDALGPEFISHIENWIIENNISGISTDCNYQLNIEDAEIISHYDLVLFVDASQENIQDYILTRVTPSESQIEFTMHAVSAAFVLDMCNKLYAKNPPTYLLHIKGFEWELEEGLTENAQLNLAKSLAFIKPMLHNPELFEKNFL
jgi:hydrogenase maturation protease